jgi:hypothetical protein
MIKSSIKKEIMEKLESLPAEKQEKVLEFVGSLTQDKITGIPGQKLIHFSGSIGKQDLDSMRRAIEEGCEKVDLNEW